MRKLGSSKNKALKAYERKNISMEATGLELCTLLKINPTINRTIKSIFSYASSSTLYSCERVTQSLGRVSD